jgi:hypothetical protein
MSLCLPTATVKLCRLVVPVSEIQIQVDEQSPGGILKCRNILYIYFIIIFIFESGAGKTLLREANGFIVNLVLACR